MQDCDLSVVKALVADAVDVERRGVGLRRQHMVCEGKSPDYAPLCLGHVQRFVGDSGEDRTFKRGEHWLSGGAAVPELAQYPHFPPAAQVASPDVMLYEALWDILSWARSESDAQLTVRPAMLCVLLTIFGTEFTMGDNGAGAITKTVTLREALDVDLDDLEAIPDVQRALEFIEFFMANVPEGVSVCCPMGIGPLTLVDSILGTDVWMTFYDEPDGIRELIEKATDATIRLVELFKKALGEPIDSTYIGPVHFLNCGIKIGSDSMVMMAPDMFEDFVKPSMAKLLSHFGGGYHHSCGLFPEHMKILLDTPGHSFINLGQPELWDMGEVIGQMSDAGVRYYGYWNRCEGESLESYLRRGAELVGPQRNRAILYAYGEGKEPWADPREIMNMWHALQDEIYPAG